MLQGLGIRESLDLFSMVVNGDGDRDILGSSWLSKGSLGRADSRLVTAPLGPEVRSLNQRIQRFCHEIRLYPPEAISFRRDVPIN